MDDTKVPVIAFFAIICASLIAGICIVYFFKSFFGMLFILIALGTFGIWWSKVRDD